MKKKMMTVLMVSAFVLLSATSKLFAAEAGSITEQFGIKTVLDGAVVMQGTPKANSTKENNNSLNDAIYTTSVKLTKEFENNGKIIAKFKVGRGRGLDRSLQTYAQVNSDSDHTIDSANDVFAKINELSYEQSFLGNKLTANVGKLNFKSYFTNNKYAKEFITGTFSGDKVIDKAPPRLALRLNYAALDELDISCAYFTNTNLDYFDIKGVGILQAIYKPSQKDNYKVYAWLNNKEDYSSSKNINEKSGIYGVGISADKEINKEIGIFGRFSYKDPSVGTGLRLVSEDADTVLSTVHPLSMAWNIGSQMKGSSWSRANDVVGFAIGQIYGSSDYRKHKVKVMTKIDEENKDYKDDAEIQIELYYKFVVNERITLIPTAQYLASPKGGNDVTDDNIFVYGIRTQFTF
ncbi:MAG: carbohydrate porin [Endomicrobium sp.]|uniref:carbohydrate porin n=1 Tax=Candidatus Endomicrobiellum pyrsonymphae TaxID=1408203 RepID=UPI003577F367|nr:carbohydrate porin [Endomicrobium sp.]